MPNSSDVKPWHIRGNYTFYDSDGKVEDKGVYEEWWISEKQYKRSFSGTKFAQAEFATGDGLFRTGSQAMPSASAMMLRTNLIQPLLENDLLKEFKLKQHNESIKREKYDCVTLDYPLRANVSVPDSFFPKSCFDAAQPILRINTLGSYVPDTLQPSNSLSGSLSGARIAGLLWQQTEGGFHLGRCGAPERNSKSRVSTPSRGSSSQLE